MQTAQEQRDAREVVGDIARRLPRYVRLATRLIRDDKISARQKAPLVAAVGYAVSPLDLIPGFIPVLGQLDDLLMVLTALRRTINHIPPYIADEHLMVVGLERRDLDDDLKDVSRLTRQVSKSAARGAARLVWNGARMTGRAANRGLRTLRNR